MISIMHLAELMHSKKKSGIIICLRKAWPI